MKGRRLIYVICALSYMVALGHTIVPHEYHSHGCHSICHHHHDHPHHCCDQLSATYILSDDGQSQDDGCFEILLAQLPVPVEILKTPETDGVRFRRGDTAPPPEPILKGSSLRAPPAA